jgi:two-component system KDP operon response regulator KdpE
VRVTSPETKPSILVVDDEPQIRRLLRFGLEGAGYAVREMDTGKSGLTDAATHPPDAVILDLGLPDMSGVEVVRQLREWSGVPVMVLTVRTAESDKVAALDAGADDYVTKPFGTAELTARLRAILRRTQPEGQPAQVNFGDIEVDLSARLVRRAGGEVKLTGKEYAFLRLLVVHRGKVLTHGQILRELWGPKAEANTHYLRVHMTHLRQKLEAEPSQPRHLLTESGIGYRLVVE